MLEIRLFVAFYSGVIAVQSGPKSHTFTLILALLPSQDGVINREKVYWQPFY